MTLRRLKEKGLFWASAPMAVLVLMSASNVACDGGASSMTPNASGGSTSAPQPCKVRTDCNAYGGDAAAFVCFFGYCGADPPPCTTPCSGDQRGLTCVHSGVQAHCDGCKHDSACLFGKQCETVTGRACTPDLDGGRFGYVVDGGPCPDATCRGQ